MVGIGFFLAGLMLVAFFYWLLGKLSQEKISGVGTMRCLDVAAPARIYCDRYGLDRAALSDSHGHSMGKFAPQILPLIFRLVMSWYRSQPSQLFTSCC